jgi:AraC family transcriptional regulator of adaptative response/methylated-DNA-[protein]-cysteine methyltransferase
MTIMARHTAPETAHSADSSDDRWRAVLSRDTHEDGHFVYGVKSTGVYCKPSCPSRRPRRDRVSFFDSAEAAERGGFRACRRCKPNVAGDASATQAGVTRARAHLDANVDRAVTLEELADVAQLSPSHLQRSFKRIIGVSPKQYQNAARLGRFKSRLRAGDTVSRATYEAGFGSSSRVYENADAKLGMTPAAYRRGGAGQIIRYTLADAPIGRVLVATTQRGVCAVELGSSDMEIEAALRRDFPNAELVRDDDVHTLWVRAVLDRIRKPTRAAANRIPLDAMGTAFQMKVWEALQQIPAGERRTYAEVAASLGSPSATRAVARACATNKIAVVVPCHRVVRGDGSLAGYKWGIERKKALLDSEG